ncbi:MAG TPA: chromate resistance protein ChrB domain-containing protein [Thermoanaerobaculia bacterium]|nr:chromate resistance protein ChrB domain-containing protein [Thermoanaerobaculia bacterium]
MRWLALSYSLSDPSSSRRVAVWRRLRQLGSVSPAGSVHLLPDGDEAREAFGWLAQEIRDGGGQALILEVERLEESERGRVIDAFRAARDEDYRKIAEEAEVLVQAPDRARVEKLRRRLDEVSRIDYFAAPEGPRTAAILARLEEKPAREVPPTDPALYRGRTWVTRPRPHVDRLASAWLIRRFIDPEAVIRYGEPREGDVSFDMPGAELGHTGNRCTFETILAAFRLDDPALKALAAIVHEIDLRDGKSSAPEIAGIDGILRGWLAAGWPDEEMERHGIALFEGLYLSLQVSPSPGAGVFGGPGEGAGG